MNSKPSHGWASLCCLVFLSVFAEVSRAQGQTAVLVIHSVPGGSEVYVDDERIGTTSSEGKLRVSTLKPGKHTLRLAAAGFEDWENLIILTPGSPLSKSINLTPRNVANSSVAHPGQSQENSNALLWIGNQLRNGGRNVGFFTPQTNEMWSASSLFTDFNFQSCHISYTLTVKYVTTYRSDTRKDFTESFTTDLSKFSPVTNVVTKQARPKVMLPDYTAFWEINDTSGQKYTGTDTWSEVTAHTTSGEKSVQIVTIVWDFQDQELAQRVAKALSSAIQACGGQKEPY